MASFHCKTVSLKVLLFLDWLSVLVGFAYSSFCSSPTHTSFSGCCTLPASSFIFLENTLMTWCKDSLYWTLSLIAPFVPQCIFISINIFYKVVPGGQEG